MPLKLKAMAWFGASLAGSVGLILVTASGAQEAIPSPWALSARLDTLQLAFADELNKPLLEQSVERYRALADEGRALDGQAASGAVRASTLSAQWGYERVQAALRPVLDRIVARVTELPLQQQEYIRDQQRSAVVQREAQENQREWERQQAEVEREARERQREADRLRREANERARQAHLASIRAKGWPGDIEQLVLSGRIRIGMTTEQVRAAWGEPKSVHETLTRFGSFQQWVYGLGQYLYFDNGQLTAIQQTRTPAP
jgi:hypothetical protein